MLSHLHPDHCIDLCGLYVIYRYHPEGQSEPLPVFGPTGTRKRMADAYGLADPVEMDAEFDYADRWTRVPVVVGPFTITPAPVNHPIEAYGVRVEADGRGARLHR